jgi:hypothetical protein
MTKFLDKYVPPVSAAILVFLIYLLFTGCTPQPATVEVGEVMVVSSEDHRVYGYVRWEE